jgi:hypothetical protein
MAAGSRLYFTQNLLQRDENAQKKNLSLDKSCQKCHFLENFGDFLGDRKGRA